MSEMIKKVVGPSDDASELLVGKQLHEGMNHLASKKDVQLWVNAKKGELLEFVIKSDSGCPVDTVTSITTQTKSKTTCWKCGTDSKGDTHCWVIPCPVIVGPWEPGKVVQPGFRLAVAPMG